MRDLPRLVQGGMGVGVSNWRLARAVASRGQLGVVSGTAVEVVLARRLMEGDADGAMRRALAAFPDQAIAEQVLARYLRAPDDGDAAYRSVPQYTIDPPTSLLQLTVAGAFAEVWLAKQGHDGPVGINLLEKIQLPTLPTLYGALLAGVDHVFMGAGIPVEIPRVLDLLASHELAELPISVAGAKAAEHVASFDPRTIVPVVADRPLRRPTFVAIVSSTTLAKYLAGHATGAPDAFVVEAPEAGGHNAPPRRKGVRNAAGEPVYGPRDSIDLEAVAALGKPFWLAGGRASRRALEDALSSGAAGVQVGTAFAFCDESGVDASLKRRVLQRVVDGTVEVHTDPVASPTGFPFKLVRDAATVGGDDADEARPRRCDLGYLREPYARPDGRIGYRCPGEPVDDYVAKGGEEEATVGRRCLCNGLVATIGLGQRQPDGYVEPPLVTAGDDLLDLGRLLPDGAVSYTAADVIDHVLSSAVATA